MAGCLDACKPERAEVRKGRTTLFTIQEVVVGLLDVVVVVVGGVEV